MSAAGPLLGASAGREGGSAERVWAERWRQLLVVARLEVRKTFLRPRTFPVYLLAAIPIFLTSMFALLVVTGAMADEAAGIQQNINVMFAGTFTLIQRFSIYFSCVWLFVNLFRGELIDRTLHYPFLAPVRREILLVGKFVAGVALVGVLYTLTTTACFGILHLPFLSEGGVSELVGSGAVRQLFSYVLVAVLGCVGYGALFALIGLLFKNPIVPALVIWLYELINYLLPPLIKKVSVIYYLESLRPLQLGTGGFAIVGQPTSPWVSVPGILAVTVVLLALAAWRLRRLEIDYSSE